MGLSPSVQSRLKALSDQFEADLPARLEAITHEADTLLTEPSEDRLRDLRMAVHKLAGSAATFGFVSITTVARRAEHLIDHVLGEPNGLNTGQYEEIRRQISELGRETPSTATASEVVSEIEPGGGTPETPGLILTVATGATIDSLEQRIFSRDAKVKRLGGMSEVAHELKATEVSAIIIELPAGPGGLLSLAELDSLHRADLPPVFVLSEEDTIKVRMIVTRFPGAAYMPSPYNLDLLADRLFRILEPTPSDQLDALIAGEPGGRTSAISKIFESGELRRRVVHDVVSLLAELIFSRPAILLLADDLTDARRSEVSRLIAQDETIVGTEVVYALKPDDAITPQVAFEAGADRVFLSNTENSLRAFLTATAPRLARSRVETVFGWLHDEVTRAHRLSRELSLVVAEVDQIDQLRSEGKGLLAHQAMRTFNCLLIDRLRQSDTIHRNEITGLTAVLFDASATVAKTVLQEIVTSFEQPRHARLHVTVSVGIASFPAFDGPGPLLDAANRALARAKDRVSESVIEIEEAEPS